MPAFLNSWKTHVTAKKQFLLFTITVADVETFLWLRLQSQTSYFWLQTDYSCMCYDTQFNITLEHKFFISNTTQSQLFGIKAIARANKKNTLTNYLYCSSTRRMCIEARTHSKKRAITNKRYSLI